MRQGQKVTVFLDRKSKKNLKSQGIAAKEILTLASRNFLRQGIRIRYDLKLLKIKTWPGIKLAWQPEILTEKWFLDETMEIAQKRAKSLLKEFNQERQNVLIMLVGHIPQGCGRAIKKWFLENLTNGNADGKGLIIIGTGFVKKNKITRKEALEKYARLIMHEHGHLYGLDHVDQEGMVMYPFTSCGGARFDGRSQKILQRKTKTAL